jgi:phasin
MEMQNTPNFAELPDSIRNIVKSSIEQTRKAFDTFVASSEKVLHGIDTSSNPVADNLKQLNEKITAFTKQNAEANFNLALRLADARQLSEIVELQNAHVREQMEAFSRQMEELRDMTVKAVKDGSKAATSAVQQAASGTPANSYFGS